ncbi:hypothetical protein [Saccharopolyspora sp. 6V]|uniref:hypothetical protein n=1 Tax=Saccharopolyspora sp. 6V TaxID=2877239 RepID=UPI001CD7B38F|nr:hypothetical protein [Saccharopolyspora sp. 6V]MCA1191614.1 hypothetical protein [Saccharopolyspora sp. 6V]
MKQLKGWDQRVTEARHDPVELPVSETETLQIDYPSKKRINALNAASRTGDLDGMTLALLGPEAGQRVLDLAEDQPGDILDGLLVDVLDAFGLRTGKAPETAPDTSPTSPNGSTDTATLLSTTSP